MSEQIILAVAGVVGPFLTNLLKGWFRTDMAGGKPALGLTIGVSFGLAFLAKFGLPQVLGGFPAVDLPVETAAAEVFAVATIIYKFFIASGKK